MAPTARRPCLLAALASLAGSPGADAVLIGRCRRALTDLKCLNPEGLPAVSTARLAPPQECRGWEKQVEALTQPEGDLVFRQSASKWASVKRLLPLSLDSLRRAAAPLGYTGARRRLRLASLRLAQGLPVHIAVLGGSMACGGGTGTPGSLGEEWAPLPWSRLLQEDFARHGFDVTVHNFAHVSSESDWPIQHVIPVKAAINRSDIIIIDYLNDAMNSAAAMQERSPYRELVETLLSLPQRPAVVELATVHTKWVAVEGRADSPSAHARYSITWDPRLWCTKDLGKNFLHFGVVSDLQLPLISMPDALCGLEASSKQYWWQLTPGEQRPHPNATTHEAIARTLRGVLALEAERACQGDMDRDHSRFHFTIPEHVRCLSSSPRVSLDFSLCEEATAAASPKCGLAARAERGSGWRLARDLNEKPMGWLALPTPAEMAAAYIDFPINVSRGGWIRLDYLATYRNISSVRCWLQGGNLQAFCTVDGLHAAPYSTTAAAYFQAVGNEGGAEVLRCKAAGKFKVFGIATC